MKNGIAKVKLLVALCGACLLCLAIAAIAGNVADRVTTTLVTGTGAGTWTNTQKYASLELKRVWAQANLNATNIITISRVTSDNLYTQSVGSITCSANAGSTASFTAAYLKYGDMLTFSSFVSTGGVIMIEYEQQEH